MAAARRHVLASYNMSWASAAGHYGLTTPPCSERDFLRRATRPREFWDNAYAHLIRFIGDLNPSIVGLQEMIEPPAAAQRFPNGPPAGAPGTVDQVKAATNPNYFSKVGKITYTANNGNNIDACVMTLWRKNLGAREAWKCVNLAGRNDGRPMLMVYTSNGYLIINIHAPQNLTLQVLQDKVNYHLATFILEYNIEFTAEKTYVVGDFNNINIDNQNRLVLFNGVQGVQFGLRPGVSVNSCCFTTGTQRIAQYNRVGDYCLGLHLYKVSTNPDVYRNLAIHPPQNTRNGESIESDHELVWAEFRE